MKLILTILVMVILSFPLSGCGAANMAVQNETSLIKAATNEAAQKCRQFGDMATGEPKGRENALKFQHCMAEVADKILIPKSAFPDIWLDARAKGLRLARKYHDDQISDDEYQAQKAEIAAASLRQMQARLDHMQQKQMQAAKDLQDLGNSMILQDALMRANAPRTVNCQSFGNQVTCTEH